MDSSLAEFDVNVCWPGDLDAGPGSEGTRFVVDWGSLYDFLTRLEDRRDPRGVRYPLAWVLTMALLAKLAGENRLTGIAEWVQLWRGHWGCRAPKRPTGLRTAGSWGQRCQLRISRAWREHSSPRAVSRERRCS